MQQIRLLRIIREGIEAVASEQLPDGGFLHGSYFAASSVPRLDAVFYETTFFASIISSCLNAVQGFPLGVALIAAPTLCDGAAHFLLSQKSPHWSFNYWARGAKEREVMPYPDDLDDTFLGLAALHGYDPALIDGAVLASVARMLTSVEVVPGGPYRTWLVQPDAPTEWRDVDVVVNSNIGYFLNLIGISLPNLTQFIEEKIAAKDICSPYYPGIVQAVYFISRFYGGEQKAALVEMLMGEREGASDGVSLSGHLWANPLETAMAMSALINLGYGAKITGEDMALFVERLDREGWQSYAFCIDPQRDGKTCYAGSRALTAAFCVEALTKYIQLNNANAIAAAAIKGVTGTNFSSKGKTILKNIKSLARERISRIFEDGPQPDLKYFVLEQVESIEGEEIVLVPYLVYEALGQPETVSATLLGELALANLYGWIAYTIYDNFLDGEGDPLVLSAANFFLRELTAVYYDLNRQIPGIRCEYEKIMNIIDDANAGERARVGNFNQTAKHTSLEKLADKSLGHALPALAVVLAAGYTIDSREAQATLLFFRNYLVARQLHDDAHDWKEDLLRGHVNGVGSRLLALFKKCRGTTLAPVDISNMSGYIPELQKLFWREAIQGVVGDIKSFLNRACEDLSGVHAFANQAPLLWLLDRLDSAADRTLRERDDAIRFIDTYSGLGLG